MAGLQVESLSSVYPDSRYQVRIGNNPSRFFDVTVIIRVESLAS